MLAVGGVHAVALQVALAELKQPPDPPVGVTVILTLSPPDKPLTWYVTTLPIDPTFTVLPPFTWYVTLYPVAPLTADQLNVTDDVVDTPQLIVGLKIGLTTIVSVVEVAHCPAAGIKVYVVVAVLLSAGLHAPVIPLLDVVGSADSVAPEHIAATGVNVGVTVGLTTIVSVAVVAHCPASGVKVYVVVAVLFSAGLHVPLIPLFDVVGSADSVAPEHIAATGVNVGVVCAVITTGAVALTPGQPPLAATVYVTV